MFKNNGGLAGSRIQVDLHINVDKNNNNNKINQREKKAVIPPGIEPGTLSVLDSRDNRYTTESQPTC